MSLYSGSLTLSPSTHLYSFALSLSAKTKNETHGRVSGDTPEPPMIDRESFERFYEETAPGLRRYLRKIANSSTVVDDILQSAYVRFINRPRKSLGEKAHKAYLFQIATNLMRDHWRKERRERSGLSEFLDRLKVRLTPEGSRPSEHFDLETALGRMPARERALLWLAHAEGYSHEEIARLMDLQKDSVRVLLFRGRRRLGAILERSLPGERR